VFSIGKWREIPSTEDARVSFQPHETSDEVETVTLIPYGATRLRMAFLPIITS